MALSQEGIKILDDAIKATTTTTASAAPAPAK
jgi:hypothetical protein